jgi:hypothetical protein
MVSTVRRCQLFTVVAGLALLALATAIVPPSQAGAATESGDVTAAASAPAVAAALTGDGLGAWVAFADGRVSARGSATPFGDLTAVRLNAPIRQIVVTASERGYWLVAADGGTFSFGDARFFGSMGGTRLNAPVVSMAPTASGNGYWLVASDGGIFSFGDARFFGSMGGKRLNRPVNGITASPTGGGYRFVADDGGVFSFGDAPFYGSSAASQSTAVVVAMAPAPGNSGYWTARADGSVDAFGSARHLGGGSAGRAIAGVAAARATHGYVLVDTAGELQVFGAVAPALASGSTYRPTGARCYVGLHGWDGYGEDGLPGLTATNIQPNGNIALGYNNVYKTNTFMWMYYDDQFDYPASRYPQASYSGALAVVRAAVAARDCGQIVVQGFSNGGAFAAKLYCRGETFGGRVVGFIIDDPVTDKGVDNCARPAGVRVKLYHSTDLMATAGAGGPCRPYLTWFCDGNWRYTAPQYDALIGASNDGPFKLGHYPSKDEYAAVMNAWWN